MKQEMKKEMEPHKKWNNAGNKIMQEMRQYKK